MTMPISTYSNSTPHSILPVSSVLPSDQQLDKSPLANTKTHDILTPEQQNTLQKTVEERMAASVDNIKGNYQTAKDIDLMQAYYQQQQKLFDIYMTTSNGEPVSSSNEPEDINAVSSLTNAYSELYQTHKNVKEGLVTLAPETIPEAITRTDSNQLPANNIEAFTKHKMGAYNDTMMPSTSSYIHLSA